MFSGPSEALSSTFHYVRSCDLDLPLRVKVCTLEGGAIARPTHEDLLRDPGLRFCGRHQSQFPDLLVTATVSSCGRPLHTPPVRATYRHFFVRFEWNQWLEFPLRYSDLPRDAQLCLTLWDAEGPGGGGRAVGGTTVRLFDEELSGGLFLSGQTDLRVWPGSEADPSSDTATPGRKKAEDRKDNLDRLQKLHRDHKDGKMPQVDWADRLAFAELERIAQREKQGSDRLYLTIELPEIRFGKAFCGLVHYERNGDLRNALSHRSDVVRAPDFDIQRENLVEAKHHKLARSLRTGHSDRDLKPNSEVRKNLNEIMSFPCTRVLGPTEEDLVWRYRYYLSANKKALAKFVKVINWRSKNESAPALDLVHKWAPMDPEDALELLGPDFRHPGLRRYAVQRLRQAPDSDLQLYLLQLVQALKYEKISGEGPRGTGLAPPQGGAGGSGGDANTSSTTSTSSSNENGCSSNSKSTEGLSENGKAATSALGGLAGFLIERACANVSIANYLYWYLTIECEEGDEGAAGSGGGSGGGGSGGGGSSATASPAHHPSSGTAPGGPASTSSAPDRRVKDMYNLVLSRLRGALKSGPQDAREKYAFLERQRHFVERLVQLIKAVHRESGNRQKKIERLQALLRGGPSSSSSSSSSSVDSSEFDFRNFSEPMRLPLDPDVLVGGLVPERANLFKSSLMPARLAFKVEGESGGGEYVTLFKLGDDLRQDQLILQMITLMDRILQQENLDLKLTPYRVLATSSRHGFVQFVDSQPIADILTTDGTIQNFFKKHAPSETGPYGIQAEVMDTYVKSCAGYCVITFILGVGDRHLDNLLITRRGNLFHIDFGYILGRDPKVLPPPMKLSREMIEAFGPGGGTSEHYTQFKKECYTAYLSLRRHSNLLLNLFSLMVDASVPDIALEPDKTVKKVQEKFKLELEDEAAVGFLETVIDDSAAAVMPAIVDRMHKLAQFMRT